MNTKETKQHKKWNAKTQLIALVCASVLASIAIFFALLNLAPYYKMLSKKEFLANAQDVKIPIIEINTAKNKEPHNKKDYVDCSVTISNADESEHNLSVEMGGAGIRLRGNSTRTAEKKPYRIKFDEKTSLFGMTKNKSWVLLADYYDQSSIRNYTALTLGSYLDNLNFTPSTHHVALIMNGTFRGLYLLTDQVDENKGRTNVKQDIEEMDLATPDIPFLVEIDDNAKDEGITGVDNFKVTALDNYAEIKYPESDERPFDSNGNDISFDYIEEYVNAVFTSLKTGTAVEVSFSNTPMSFEDLVDIDSFIDYYLLAEMMVNPDVVYKSLYIYKPAGEKLQFGPIWDYDWSMSTQWIDKKPYSQSEIESASYWNYKNSFFYLYFDRGNNFEKVSARFNEIKGCMLEVQEHLRTYKEKIDYVARLDAKQWYGDTGVFQFDMQYDYVRLYLSDRYNFLNNYFN